MIAQEIPGWMTDDELAWLSSRAKDARRIVEVGAWKGRSTVALASTTHGTVWAVDTWNGAPGDPATNEEWYPDAETAYDEFCANVAGLPVVPLCMTSLTAAVLARVDGGPLDMVFIDADHRYEAVAADIQAWRPLLCRGGLLCGHDYQPRCPGVIRAVDELLPHAVIGPDSIWSVIV